ncbi:hypothetical protein MUGA111182_14960 [Mucilaginibacter galii]|uniref:hypothetical protein n=1 Tax=Mucilaginibacter galii TaxID=2005073 RepID=UPI00166EC8F8|nr:hypothetical protein [Mucilaginibacter galii]
MITKENLSEQLRDATTTLLEQARQSCWNNISDNCRFILSETTDSSAKNFIELRRLRKTVNDKKNPEPLDSVLPHLMLMYTNLHDLNLYIYRSSKNLTIVEIAYYLKSSLDVEYQQSMVNDSTMLHCKVAVPIYSKWGKPKFDINWEQETFNHRWQMFWYRITG